MEELVKNYQPNNEVLDLVKSTNFVILAGVTGAGKNTIQHELLKKPEFTRIITSTTRAPRSNNGTEEIDGVDYHFLTTKNAEEMLKNHEYVEAKFVHGNIYGIPAFEIEKIQNSGKIALANIDVQGILELHEINPTIKFYFITPPNNEEWIKRLNSRGDLSEEELQTRLETAKQEMEFAKKAGYFKFIVNDDLTTAVQEIYADATC